MAPTVQYSTKWIFSVSETMHKAGSTRSPCPTPPRALDAAKQQRETSFLESHVERDFTSPGDKPSALGWITVIPTSESVQGLTSVSKSEFGSIWLEPSACWPRRKDGCVCVRGGQGWWWCCSYNWQPQEAWMGLSWGPTSWFWGPSEQLDLGSLLSLLVLNLWSCQAEQRLWEEEPELLVEFRSSQDRGW